MTITIEIEPELEQQLQQAAAKIGISANAYIEHLLHNQFTQPRSQRIGDQRLSNIEASLLLKINQCFDHIAWTSYHELIDKRQAETLTSEEQEELIRVIDQIEDANVQRIELLAELARLRNTKLNTLIQELGLQPVAHA